MAEWIDVRERLPENSCQWENYIVAVIHANPLYFTGNTFVVPALYNSQQKYGSYYGGRKNQNI